MLRILCCLCLGLSISLNVCAYTTPEAFMQLYFEFGGNGEPDYPRGQLTIPQVLIQSQKLNMICSPKHAELTTVSAIMENDSDYVPSSSSEESNYTVADDEDNGMQHDKYVIDNDNDVENFKLQS